MERSATANHSIARDKFGYLGLKVVTTLEEVVQDPEIDLVVISTPNKTHYPIAKVRFSVLCMPVRHSIAMGGLLTNQIYTHYRQFYQHANMLLLRNPSSLASLKLTISFASLNQRTSFSQRIRTGAGILTI
jgi:hypothetical protein